MDKRPTDRQEGPTSPRLGCFPCFDSAMNNASMGQSDPRPTVGIRAPGAAALALGLVFDVLPDKGSGLFLVSLNLSFQR